MVVPEVVPKLSVDTFTVDELVVVLFAVSEFDVDELEVDELVVPLFAVFELDVDELDVDELDVDALDVDVLTSSAFTVEAFSVVKVIKGTLMLLTLRLLTLRVDVGLPTLITVVVSVYKLTTLGGDLDWISSITSSFAVITPPSIVDPAPSSIDIIPFILRAT